MLVMLSIIIAYLCEES